MGGSPRRKDHTDIANHAYIYVVGGLVWRMRVVRGCFQRHDALNQRQALYPGSLISLPSLSIHALHPS